MNNPRNGIPYFEALERLDAELGMHPEGGTLFTHERLRAIVQADERRYRGILRAWMERLKERGLQATGTGRARGIGILICDGREHTVFVVSRVDKEAKSTKTTAESAKNVNTSDFSEAELAQHNILVRVVNAMRDSAKKAKKEIHAPPAPISGSNVRVLNAAR